ncbi:MAG: helix-turn-helix domain-containing protein [Planctomycetes bacterium]|nr:helix-turn-helix domain-containing protein [Planctomycetota bacterium]
MFPALIVLIGDYPDNPITAGQALTKTRADLGLTKKALASLAGVNEATIARCEQDRRCQWRSLRKIRAVMGSLHCDEANRNTSVKRPSEAKLTAEQIWPARAAAALSQFDLAKLAGLDEGTIRYIEKGNHKPSAATLRKIETAFRAII